MKSSSRTTLQLALAAVLVLVGWAVGRAQTSAPAFELVVNAPGGKTSIECVKGCKLAWVERGVGPDTTPSATFTYACTADRCTSGRVGAWTAN